MIDASVCSRAGARTRVELYLPGGRRFTLMLRGRGVESLELAGAK